jgi:hypothetical protein
MQMRVKTAVLWDVVTRTMGSSLLPPSSASAVTRLYDEASQKTAIFIPTAEKTSDLARTEDV